MSLYEPLTGPAIPTLNELRSDQRAVEVSESAEQKKVAAMEAPAPAYVVVTQTTVETAGPTVVPAEKYMVRGCCCFSLPTGVYLLALFETVGWCFSLIAALFAIVLETQKGRIDRAIKNGDADADADASTSEDGATADGEAEDTESTSDKIHSTNHAIDAGAIGSIFLIIMAVIGLYFCCKGFKAARGDVDAARSFYLWRRVAVVYAVFQGLLGMNGGPLGGIFGVALAIYYALVVRSHWINLKAQAQAEAIETTTSVTVASAV